MQQIEPPLDPKVELQRLISEHKFGEAFTAALQRSDVSIVSWLCSQVFQVLTCTKSKNILFFFVTKQSVCDAR